jgi:hypothetical protein
LLLLSLCIVARRAKRTNQKRQASGRKARCYKSIAMARKSFACAINRIYE